jgi:urease accessory protein
MQMFSPPAILQRARGRAEVAVSRRDGAIRLDRLYQQGCAKAFLPGGPGSATAPDAVPEVVLVNTSGGLAGGDRLDYGLSVGPGAALVATTQAAERVYRSREGAARLAVTLEVGAGAALDWLPQETILFQHGRLARRLEADMATDARLTLLETLVLGRAAMGEVVTQGHYSDQWRIRRGGRLVHAEALRLDGDLARIAPGPATLRHARAMATLVHIGPEAEARLAAARDLAARVEGIEAAVSLRGDVLILRLLAPDHAPLRRALARVIQGLRGAALPRVWIREETAP